MPTEGFCAARSAGPIRWSTEPGPYAAILGGTWVDALYDAIGDKI